MFETRDVAFLFFGGYPVLESYWYALPPQVRAALGRAFGLAVSALAGILIGLLLELSAAYTGGLSLVFLFAARLVEGWLDARRDRLGDVRPADVGYVFATSHRASPYTSATVAQWHDALIDADRLDGVLVADNPTNTLAGITAEESAAITGPFSFGSGDDEPDDRDLARADDDGLIDTRGAA